MAEKHRWSISRVNTLRQCPRKFYFATILSHHGHNNNLKRKAYELKKMQNFFTWPGNVVDKIMETVVIPKIQNKEPIDFLDVAEEAVALAERQFKFSEAFSYKNPDLTKEKAGNNWCILDIHEIGRSYNDIDLSKVYKKIKTSILNIESIKLPNTNKFLIDYLKESFPLIPNVINWSFEIERSRVTPQIDLILYNDFKPVVIDWKVSDSFASDYSRQLIVCGLTVYFTRLKKAQAEGKRPYSYPDIKLFEINLYRGEIKQHLFTQERANGLIDYINLTGSDIFLIHEQLKGNDSDILEFELTEKESTCKFCNFQTLCENLLLNNNHYNENTYSEFIQSQQFI